MKYRTLEFKDGVLKLLDQRRLPVEIDFYEAKNYREVETAISDMVVRGAPAIGAAAAYGVYLAALEYRDLPGEEFFKKVFAADRELAAARPTAVNLTWAINRMEKVLKTRQHKSEGPDQSIDGLLADILKEADKIALEDVEINKAMARHGYEVVPERGTVLTHCNAGALATVDYGTALGVIREAHFRGKRIRVYADETRPRLQGARLTAFELVEEGIPVTLIADSVAATLIRDGKIDLILVGADRIAANGDTANKIGTYMLSEMALKFKVPFYIAAPMSTIDFELGSGREIEIEERSPDELTHIRGLRIAPEGVNVYNPAFDVTPAANITGIITEKGIIRPPFTEGIASLRNKQESPGN